MNDDAPLSFGPPTIPVGQYVGPMIFRHNGLPGARVDHQRAQQLHGVARDMATSCLLQCRMSGLAQTMRRYLAPDGTRVQVNVLAASYPPQVIAWIWTPEYPTQSEQPVHINEDQITDCKLFYCTRLDTDERFILYVNASKQWKAMTPTPECELPPASECTAVNPAYWVGWGKEDVLIYQSQAFYGYGGKLLLDCSNIEMPHVDSVCKNGKWYIISTGKAIYSLSSSSGIAKIADIEDEVHLYFNSSASEGVGLSDDNIIRVLLTVSDTGVSASVSIIENKTESSISNTDIFEVLEGSADITYLSWKEPCGGGTLFHYKALYNYPYTSHRKTGYTESVKGKIENLSFQRDTEVSSRVYRNSDIITYEETATKTATEDYWYYLISPDGQSSCHCSYSVSGINIHSDIVYGRSDVSSRYEWSNFSLDYGGISNYTGTSGLNTPACEKHNCDEECSSISSCYGTRQFNRDFINKYIYLDIPQIDFNFLNWYSATGSSSCSEESSDCSSSPCSGFIPSSEYEESDLYVRQGEDVLLVLPPGFGEVISYAYNTDWAAAIVLDYYNEYSGPNTRTLYGLYDKKLTDITELVGGATAVGDYDSDDNLISLVPISGINCKH